MHCGELTKGERNAAGGSIVNCSSVGRRGGVIAWFRGHHIATNMPPAETFALVRISSIAIESRAKGEEKEGFT